MNRIYNTIWNEARGTYVVAHEKSKSKGKPASTRKGVVNAVTAALLSMSAGAALAAGWTANSNTTDDVSLSSGQSITTGVIGSGTFSGSINNSGTISGTRAIGLLAGSSISGQITNQQSGTISGGSIGIFASNSTISGGITNSGNIAGGILGILASNASTIGGISNSGTISSGNNGIYARSSTINGGITNSGSISGGSNGIYAFSGSTIGGISNSGNISGGDVGIYVRSSTISGGINNSNTISGGSNGIYVRSSTISGGINNSGSIAGGSTGILARSSTINGISNSGSISGGSYGIYAFSGSTIGGITNSGNIASGSNGIYASNGSTIGSISNSGIISGGRYGIGTYNSTISGGITNSGNIAGDYTGISALYSTINGGISNSGTISGGINDGIHAKNSTINAISNSGIISGSRYGILARSSSTINGISNSGTIAGGNYGIYAQTNATSSSTIGGITNSGTISGGTHAIYIDSDSILSSLSSLSITGNNTAKFIGRVYAPNTPVSVLAGATYTMDNGNHFTVAQFNNAGTLAIGADSTGTISGNFSNTGTFSPAVAGMTSYGKLAVSGTATLGGTMAVNVIGAPSLVSGGTIAGVITAGSVAGTFGSVTDNSNLFDFSAAYTGTNVNLTIAAASNASAVTGVTSTGNTGSLGAATVFDQLINAGSAAPAAMAPVITALGQLGSAQQVSDAVSQTTPALAGGQNVAIGGVLNNFSRIVQARIEGASGRSSGDDMLTDKHFWLKPFGSKANQSGQNGGGGYNANSYGLVLGADATVSDNNRLGVAFAYANTNLNGSLSTSPQSSRINSYQLIAYGSHSLDENTDLSFQADIGKNDTNGSRSILFINSIANASYSSWSGHVGAALARTYSVTERTSFTPSVRADYTAIRSDAYSESNAGALNLNVGSNSTSQMILGVDGKLSHSLTDSIKAVVNLGAGYDVINDSASITSAYAGAPTATFVTNGINPSPWLARGGLGLVGNLDNGVELSARYDIEARQRFDNQTASVKVRWAF
jgi:outer membrane autotransporter protein